jgi:hypothetical protein
MSLNLYFNHEGEVKAEFATNRPPLKEFLRIYFRSKENDSERRLNGEKSTDSCITQPNK